MSAAVPLLSRDSNNIAEVSERSLSPNNICSEASSPSTNVEAPEVGESQAEEMITSGESPESGTETAANNESEATNN